MASLRVLLLLLLVSSSLLHLSDSMKPNTKAKVKKGLKQATAYVDDKLVPFLRVIPGHGALAAAVAHFFLTLVPGNGNAEVLNKLTSEFQNQNIKLDNYHVEQKWDTWASGAYHKPEVKINNAWQKYEELDKLYSVESDAEKKEKLKNEMIDACSKGWDNTKTLHSYLTAKPPTFMSNLGQTLAESLNCHEKDIEIYRNFIGQLIAKGVILNQKCIKLKEQPDQAAKEAKVIYDAASAMFHVQRNCIFNSAEYIRKDVENLMGGTNIDKQKLADEIRSFLAKNYDRYDWMVVVFQTEKSNHETSDLLNKHIVDGFMKVERGGITVAVARQVKGSHSKAAEVQQAIDSCFKPKEKMNVRVPCESVLKKLSECVKSRPYTAVHVVRKKAEKSNQSYEQNKSGQKNIPRFYSTDCIGGGFVVMIKSDEERTMGKPCSNMDCGGPQRGTCVHADDVFVAMCQCKEPFFGLNCEHDMDEFRRYFQVVNNMGSNGRQPQVRGNNRGQLQVVDNRSGSNGRQPQVGYSQRQRGRRQ